MNLVQSIEMLHVVFGQATPGDGVPPSPMGGLMQMAPLMIAFIFIMYFLTIRPQQKRDRERQAMLSALSKGDEVVTTGGICGRIVSLKDHDVVLRVDDDVTIKFVRSAIAQVVSAGGENED